MDSFVRSLTESRWKVTSRAVARGVLPCAREEPLLSNATIYLLSPAGLLQVAYKDTPHYALTRDFLMKAGERVVKTEHGFTARPAPMGRPLFLGSVYRARDRETATAWPTPSVTRAA